MRRNVLRRRVSRFRPVLAMVTAVVASALAGCAGMVTTQTSYDAVFRSGVPSEFSYAAGGSGVMPVVVVGNPFSLPKADVDRRVIAAMQGSTHPPARFVPAEGDELRGGYAVVVLLDAASGSGGSAGLLCARRASGEEEAEAATTAPGGAHAPQDLGLLAAFCGNGDPLSWAWSTTGPVASADDPRFRALVAQTTSLMLPPRDDQPRAADYF